MDKCQVIDTRTNGHSIGVSKRNGALPALLRACDRARTTQRDLWQFAVVFDELKSAGVRSSELRSLIARGLVAHALEQTPLRTGQRRFQTVKSMSFTQESCFVLTLQGEMAARQNGSGASTQSLGLANDRANNTIHSSRITTTPTWNCDQRILSLGELVIKKFKRPAPQQELLLACFQELNWIRHMYDPIPPEKGMDAKGRLHDTIKKLNHGQLNPLIRFYGDGTGRGVCWELRWHMG